MTKVLTAFSRFLAQVRTVDSPLAVLPLPQGTLLGPLLPGRPWRLTSFLFPQYGRNISLLADVPTEEFVAIKQKGIGVVWLMGVWALGPYGLHYDRTDPGLLATYASVLPGYTEADIIG